MLSLGICDLAGRGARRVRTLTRRFAPHHLRTFSRRTCVISDSRIAHAHACADFCQTAQDPIPATSARSSRAHSNQRAACCASRPAGCRGRSSSRASGSSSHPNDLYAFGLNRGGIDERWFASTTPAANDNRTPDEGLSYVVHDGNSASRSPTPSPSSAAKLIGDAIWNKYKKWPVYSKFFDNMGPIPHHMHQIAASRPRWSARKASPRATTSRRSTTTSATTSPTRSWASSPARPRRRSASASKTGTRATTASSTSRKAYRLKPGTGWLIHPCILHAPGSLCTYEPQWGSRRVRHVPVARRRPRSAVGAAREGHAQGEAQGPRLHRRAARLGSERRPALQGQPLPRADRRAPARDKDGYVDKWIVYGKVDGEQLFTAKELTVEPGPEGDDQGQRRLRPHLRAGRGQDQQAAPEQPEDDPLPRADRRRSLRHRIGRQGRRDVREHQRHRAAGRRCATSARK